MWSRIGALGALSMAIWLAAPRAELAVAKHPVRESSEEKLQRQSVLYRAAATGKARTFLTAAYVAGLTDTLRNDGPFTVFVPTDQAFANLPEEAMLDLLKIENQKKLVEILKYHVVPGRILAAEITNEPRPKTVLGPRLTIAANDHGVAVDGATVVKTDLIGRNGVVHFIDRVLTPPSGDVISLAEKDGNFTLLLAAVEAAGLTETLREADHVTILAPTDEAFSRLGEKNLKALLKDKDRLKEILLYHVLGESLTAQQLLDRGSVATLLGPVVNVALKGGRPTVVEGNVPFLTRDQEAANGYLQIIDAVLMPPAGDVIAVAEKAGNFKLLLAAVEAAGLTETLRNQPDLTILAPTDEAFLKLGEKNIKALLKDKERLTRILKYHVLPGRLSSEQLLERRGRKTLLGETVTARLKGGRLQIAEGEVGFVDTDVAAGNGVIHVIDAVLMPSGGMGDHH